MDDDQDMEDMYLGRRRGEDAMAALEHMAYIAETYSEGTQTDDEDDSGNADGVSSPAGPVAHSWNHAGVSFRIGPFPLAKRFACLKMHWTRHSMMLYDFMCMLTGCTSMKSALQCLRTQQALAMSHMELQEACARA